MTRQQAAGYLQCHINHVDRLRAEGLPTVGLGRSIRINRDALDAWMVSRQRGGGEDDEARTRPPVPAEQRRPVDRKGQRRPRRAPALPPGASLRFVSCRIPTRPWMTRR
jgi:excisionase family DNA binding protein